MRFNSENKGNKESDILGCFSGDDFLSYLKKYKIRDIDSNNYSSIVRNACRYGVLYMIQAIAKKDKSLLEDVRIVEGSYNGFWHCWLSTKKYYVDVTIAQFNKDYPSVFKVRKNDAEKTTKLRAENFYTIKEWFEWEESH